MRHHIAIIGSALSGNKGASGMLEAAIATLTERLPDVTFSLLSMYPDEDRRLNDHANLEIIDAAPRQLGVTINVLALVHRLVPAARPLIHEHSRAVRALTDAQVLLDQGGITFTDGREKFLLYNTASILPAINLGTPIVKCAQAIGPFRHRLNRIVSRMFLPRVEAIVTRGRHTQRFGEELGLTNLHPGADFAFALELRGDEAGMLAQHIDLAFFDGHEQVVGVCPSTVLQKKVEGRGDEYVTTMASVVDRLAATGHKVLLLPHCARPDTDDTHNNDLPLCRDIMAHVHARPSHVAFLDGELSARTLRHAIGRCDLFVASRFHAMVSALAMEVPTVVIGWSHKYEEVLEMFELSAWALDDAALDAAHLVDRVRELDAQAGLVTERLRQHLPRVKALATQQADLVAQIVGMPAAGSLAGTPGPA